MWGKGKWGPSESDWSDWGWGDWSDWSAWGGDASEGDWGKGKGNGSTSAGAGCSGYGKAQSSIATRSAGPYAPEPRQEDWFQKQDWSQQQDWWGYGSQMDPMTAMMAMMMMSGGGIPYKGHGGGVIKGDSKLMVYVGNLDLKARKCCAFAF